MGTIVVDASQAGNTNYLSAPQVQQSLLVSFGPEDSPVIPAINGNNNITLPYYQFDYSGALNATSPAGKALSNDLASITQRPLQPRVAVSVHGHWLLRRRRACVRPA